MLIKLRANLPEIVVGVLLTVAVFAMGMTFESSRNQPPEQIAYDKTTNADQANNQSGSIRDWLTHDATGFFTLFLVGVGLIQIGVFLRQLHLIHETLGPAKEAADAAKLNAQAVMDAERAHIYPVIKSTNIKEIFRGPIWYGESTPDENVTPEITVRYCLKNIGKSPATLEHIAQGMTFREVEKPYALGTVSVAHQPLEIIAASGETDDIEYEGGMKLTYAQAKNVLQFKGELIFHGHFTFRDFFNRKINCSWQFLGSPRGFHLMKITENAKN